MISTVVDVDEELTVAIRGKQRARKGVRDHARSRGDYHLRPFVAWDGEGWTDGDGVHHYCLFGNSSAESIEGESLSTDECLDLIVRANPRSIHVGFSFGYDVNMILRDLSWRQLGHLKRHTWVVWNGYRIEHIPGKWLAVVRGHWEENQWVSMGHTVRIMDIFSFFGTSFVASLKSWDVGTVEQVERIKAGKDKRGDFSLGDLDSIRRYWAEELELLVALAAKLRSILSSAGINPKSWHGPGAVATFLLCKHGAKEYLDKELRREVLVASQYAYAGGRFETFRAGLYEGSVYSADINSAYPFVLSRLPDLRKGTWQRVDVPADMVERAFDPRTRMGLFRISFDLSGSIVRDADLKGRPFPVFHRDTRGMISFPRAVSGWFHLPEARILMSEEIRGNCPVHYTLHEAWIFEDDGTYPFKWVEDLYEQRRIWKRDGNPAERAAKLGYNSIYGKLAQRVGGKDGAPPWHQLEYAGAITSGTRALLYEPMARQFEGLIAGETDGIYSTQAFADLPNGEGDALGQWKVDHYDGILFLQNGVYWLRKGSEWLPPKSRGIPAAHLDVHRALDSLRSGQSLRASQTTFIGYGLALMRHGKGWRRWVESEKEFVFGGNGKRSHGLGCSSCRNGRDLSHGLHTLYPRITNPEPVSTGKHSSWESQPHYLPWMRLQMERSQDGGSDMSTMREQAELTKWTKDGYHD